MGRLGIGAVRLADPGVERPLEEVDAPDLVVAAGAVDGELCVDVVALVAGTSDDRTLATSGSGSSQDSKTLRPRRETVSTSGTKASGPYRVGVQRLVPTRQTRPALIRTRSSPAARRKPSSTIASLVVKGGDARRLLAQAPLVELPDGVAVLESDAGVGRLGDDHGLAPHPPS